MARNVLKASVGFAKTVNRELKKIDRESAKQQRKREMLFKKEAREQERVAKNLAVADKKDRVKAEITEAKEAYEYRCEERKLLREQIINEELK